MNDNYSGAGVIMTDLTGNHPLGTSATHSNAVTNVFEGAHGINSSPDGWFGAEYACTSNSTCNTNKAHFDFGSCAGGTSAGYSCQVDGDCPSSTCTLGVGNFTCYHAVYPDTGVPGSPEEVIKTSIGAPLFGGLIIRRENDAGTPVWRFITGVDAVSTVTAQASTTAAQNTLHVIVIQRYGSDQNIGVDGTTWEDTQTQSGDISSGFGPTYIIGGVTGNRDFDGCWRRALDGDSIRRILVCGETGADCQCNDSNPTLYASRPRHSSEGGLIAGTMPLCNTAYPTFLDAGPTTTSTTTTTSTSIPSTTSTTVATTTSITTTTSTSTIPPPSTTSTTLPPTTSTSSSSSTSTSSSTTTTPLPSTTSTTLMTPCAPGCMPCGMSASGCCSGICGIDGLCKISSGHNPAVEPTCLQYNKPCNATCECCDSMVCNENNKCREPPYNTTTSSSTSTSSSITTSTSTSTTTTTSTSTSTTTIPTTTSTTTITTTTTTIPTTTTTSTSSTTTTSTITTTTTIPSTTSTTEIGATTTTSTSSTTTTSTSSTTSTSTSTTTTSTSTSTSSTTSTSTSTTSSTTTTTLLAPDWSDEVNCILYLQAEETTPASSDLVDQSPATNNLSSGTCSTATSNTTNFWDGARSLKNDGTGFDSCSFPCTAGDGCTDSQFLFTSGDFTCGLYGRPTSSATGDTALVMGTAMGLSPGGWQIYKDLNASKWGFYIADGTDSISVLSSTSATNDTDAIVTARYDGTAEMMVIRVNGIQEDSDTQQNPSSFATDFTLMGTAGSFVPAFSGSLDHLWCFNKALTNLSLCRIEVCGLNGSLCTCNGAAYVSKPKHVGSGGPIDCTLPNCNTASPSFIN